MPASVGEVHPDVADTDDEIRAQGRDALKRSIERGQLVMDVAGDRDARCCHGGCLARPYAAAPSRHHDEKVRCGGRLAVVATELRPSGTVAVRQRCSQRADNACAKINMIRPLFERFTTSTACQRRERQTLRMERSATATFFDGAGGCAGTVRRQCPSTQPSGLFVGTRVLRASNRATTSVRSLRGGRLSVCCRRRPRRTRRA